MGKAERSGICAGATSARTTRSTLIWQASAPEMNPSLPADYLACAWSTTTRGLPLEVLGEFRAGLATLLDPEAIAACVASDRLELPPVSGPLNYQAFCDPSAAGAPMPSPAASATGTASGPWWTWCEPGRRPSTRQA